MSLFVSLSASLFTLRAQVLKGSHTFPLLGKRSEGKGVQKSGDRRGAEDENVLGTHIDLDVDEREVVLIPLMAGVCVCVCVCVCV